MKLRYAIFAGISSAAIVGMLPFALEAAQGPVLGTYPSEAKYRLIVRGGDINHGDFYSNDGTKFHFDEKGVIEGGSLEIKPLGSLHLTTPINGLSNVELNFLDNNTRFKFAWCSAPYEAMDIYDGGGDHGKGLGKG